MNTLWTSWQWSGTGIAGIGLLSAAYLWLWKFRPKKKGAFFAAALLLALCFFSPLAVLSTQYLFSAHMAVHVILLLLVGPLLVLSLPDSLPPWLARVAGVLIAHPMLGWLAGIGVMWLWHLPPIFNAAMAQGHATMQLLHAAESVSLLTAGMLFSCPVLGASRRMHPLGGVVYLGTACVCCSLLGLLITFAPAGLYHHYLAMHDAYGLNAVIQNNWALSRAEDQQAAGLIMWVPCCMIYLAGSLYLLQEWFEEKELRATIKSFSKKSTL